MDCSSDGRGFVDFHIVREASGLNEGDLNSGVEIFKRCICRAGDCADHAGEGDDSEEDLDLQEVIWSFAVLLVRGPVGGLPGRS